MLFDTEISRHRANSRRRISKRQARQFDMASGERKPFACLNVCGFVQRMLGRDMNYQPERTAQGTMSSKQVRQQYFLENGNDLMLQRSAEVQSSLDGLLLLAPPQCFSDLFVTSSVIGEGSFGIVYSAKLTEIGQTAFPWMEAGCTCAVKKTRNAFQKGQPLDEIHRSALRVSKARSAEFFKILTSKEAAENHIVRVHGQVIEPHSGVNALIMELLPGPDFLDWTSQFWTSPHTAVLKEDDIARLTRQMLKALHYLHRVAGALHRDVKLENFGFAQPLPTGDSPSLGALPTLRLFDFGTAWILPEPVTDDNASKVVDLRTVGTCPWLSPEVVAGKCGAMSDVWSVGLIAFYLMTGDLPWNLADCSNVGSVASTLQRNSMSTAFQSFPTDTLDCISPQALSFVSSLLNKDPTARSSTTAALEHAWLQTASCSSLLLQATDKETSTAASSTQSDCSSVDSLSGDSDF